MDGNDWFLLNAKALPKKGWRLSNVKTSLIEADFATPDERGKLVGPFIVSRPRLSSFPRVKCCQRIWNRLSAMALLGNRTLPDAAVAAPAAVSPSSDSKPFQVPQQAVPETVAPVPVAVEEITTTTVDVAQAAPDTTQTKVAQAVVQASQANGLDNAQTAATAAAVSAASEAAKEPITSEDSLSKVAEAAAAVGLSDAQVGMAVLCGRVLAAICPPGQVASVSSAFQSIHPDHWDPILHAWSAAASARAASKPPASPEAKVAAVVAATGDAGFTVEQQAAAAADTWLHACHSTKKRKLMEAVEAQRLRETKESAVPAAREALQGATTAAPISVVGQALAGP